MAVDGDIQTRIFIAVGLGNLQVSARHCVYVLESVCVCVGGAHAQTCLGNRISAFDCEAEQVSTVIR